MTGRRTRGVAYDTTVEWMNGCWRQRRGTIAKLEQGYHVILWFPVDTTAMVGCTWDLNLIISLEIFVYVHSHNLSISAEHNKLVYLVADGRYHTNFDEIISQGWIITPPLWDNLSYVMYDIWYPQIFCEYLIGIQYRGACYPRINGSDVIWFKRQSFLQFSNVYETENTNPLFLFPHNFNFNWSFWKKGTIFNKRIEHHCFSAAHPKSHPLTMLPNLRVVIASTACNRAWNCVDHVIMTISCCTPPHRRASVDLLLVPWSCTPPVFSCVAHIDKIMPPHRWSRKDSVIF